MTTLAAPSDPQEARCAQWWSMKPETSTCCDWRTSSSPVPGEGEVLVRVRAASVNPIDWKLRRGLMPKQLPAILGSDASGVVEVSNAEGFSAGEEVFGLLGSGSYAEFGIAAPGHARPQARPPPPRAGGRDARRRAHGLAGAVRARAACRRARRCSISGASGGVGHLAVQLAAGGRGAGAGNRLARAAASSCSGWEQSGSSTTRAKTSPPPPPTWTSCSTSPAATPTSCCRRSGPEGRWS